MLSILITAPTTGQTRGYSSMVKSVEDFPVDMYEDVVAEYCLDAPDWIPTGVTKRIPSPNNIRISQALFHRRGA